MTFIHIGMVDPPEGADIDVFNDWYTNKHLPATVALPGYDGAQRYELVASGPGHGDLPKYLTVYYVEGDSIEEMQESVAALNRDREGALAEGREAAIPASPVGIGRYFTAYYETMGDPIPSPAVRSPRPGEEQS